MKNTELHELIDKYVKGRATPEELKALNDYYQSTIDTDLFWEGEEEKDVKERMFHQIKLASTSTKSHSKSLVKYAAVAAVVLLVSAFSFFKIRNIYLENNSYTKVIPSSAVESKYVLLPDSSIVVLKPGSELKYAKSFDTDMRVVELKGEAYFDIKHRDNQPFIIHTGKIKTTVLGTAFSILTKGEEDIEVFVNRGKVRVDRDDNELATLTANHKLVYKEESFQEEKHIKKEVVIENFHLDDTKLDFDGATFMSIATKLENRYDVKIRFTKEDIANYQLSGAFTGLETIDEILIILCKTSGNVYRKIDENSYEITN